MTSTAIQATLDSTIDVDRRDLKCVCAGGAEKVAPGFVSLTENVMMAGMAG
jgi:hypothetical protein